MTTDLTASIKAAEQMRCRAMLANDTAALEALLDPRLHFSHATGAVDNRKSYMAKIAAGRIQYTAIKWDEEQVLALADNAALLTGRMTSDVIVERRNETPAQPRNNGVVAQRRGLAVGSIPIHTDGRVTRLTLPALHRLGR